jgi:hypothetical protein
MAAIAHFGAVVGMVAFFEFLVSRRLGCKKGVFVADSWVSTVVLGVVGCFTRCTWDYSSHQCTEVYFQDSHRGIPIQRVQAR